MTLHGDGDYFPGEIEDNNADDWSDYDSACSPDSPDYEELYDDYGWVGPGPSVKHPEIKVQLTGADGNAYSILGNVNGALRKAGVSQEERDEFYTEATSGNYDKLLKTVMSWVDAR